MIVTAQLLLSNPDVYTLWNLRRTILLDMKSDSLQQINELNSNRNQESEQGMDTKSIRNHFDLICERELSLSASCLVKNAKSYSAWFQRQFILEKMFEPDLNREILLCNEALLKDDRNFHCWDHRRYVSKLLRIPVDQEIAFTKDKINANFSNFSSWYYRSCLITEAVINNSIKVDDIWSQEYEMAENAVFTDPIDQSAWFYHRWLTLTDFDQLRTKKNHCKFEIKELVADFSLSLLIIVTNRPLQRFPQSIQVNFLKENDDRVPITMSKVHSFVADVWYARFPIDLRGSLHISTPDAGIISIPVLENSIIVNCLTYESRLIAPKVNILSEEKKKNLNELKDMEPDNKWVNLALACSEEPEGKLCTYRELCKIDPSKANYYADMMSKHRLEDGRRNWMSTIKCNLTNMQLTCLPSVNNLVHLHVLDISKNHLKKLSATLNDLVALRMLIADDNWIEYIDPNFRMVSLEIVSLKRNSKCTLLAINF